MGEDGIHLYRGRQILFLQSKDVAAAAGRLGLLSGLKDLIYQQQAGKETLEHISWNGV